MIQSVLKSLDGPESPTETEIRTRLRSRNIDQFLTLFDSHWYDLADRFAPEVLRAVEEIPAKVFDTHPRLLHAVLLSQHRISYTEGDHQRLGQTLQFQVVAGQRYAQRLASFSQPGDLIAAGAAAIASGRIRGDHDGAEQIGAWTDAHVKVRTALPLLPWTAARAAARPGWLSAERGLTAMLAGSLDQATRLFTRAYAEAGEPPYAHYAGANAASNLALLGAYRGQVDLARTWLGVLESSRPLPDWIRHLNTFGATVARSLIAIDEGDPTTALALLDRIGPATLDLELWPFAAFANASYEAHFGDPHKGLRALDTARQQHGVLRPDPTTMTGELVLRAEAKLLLRVGAGTRVLHLADRNAEVDSLMLFAAWAHLLAGEHHEATRLSSDALQHHDLPVNDLVGHHLVQAVASLRTGRPDRAGTLFLSAIRLRSTPAHVSPFLALRNEELDELSRIAGVASPLRNAAADTRHNTPPPSRLVHLTPREREVLRALSTGQTAEQAAAQFGVSVTTVRSQIRKIYQKLGVSRRQEALAKAQYLGLLRAPRYSPRGRAG